MRAGGHYYYACIIATVSFIAVTVIIASYRLARVCICHAQCIVHGQSHYFCAGARYCSRLCESDNAPVRKQQSGHPRLFRGMQLASSTTILKYQIYSQLRSCTLMYSYTLYNFLHLLALFLEYILLLVKFTKSELMLVDLQCKNLPAKRVF